MMYVPFFYISWQMTGRRFERVGQPVLSVASFERVNDSNVIGISLSILSSNRLLKFWLLAMKK